MIVPIVITGTCIYAKWKRARERGSQLRGGIGRDRIAIDLSDNKEIEKNQPQLKIVPRNQRNAGMKLAQ